MPRGRPPLRADLVQRLEGSSRAKRRLRLILQTLAGEKSVPQACAELGIQPSRFHRLRNQALQGLLGDLEPQVPGRPRRLPSPEEAQIALLHQEVQDLKIGLRAAQIREEIALLMPHLLRRHKPEAGKPPSRAPGAIGGKKPGRLHPPKPAGPPFPTPCPTTATDP